MMDWYTLADDQRVATTTWYGHAAKRWYGHAAQRHVTRLLVIQFEGYLEDNDYTYDYPVIQAVKLDGQEYIADAWLMRDEMLALQRPDSDLARVFALLQERGYHIPRLGMLQRFVRLVDEPNGMRYSWCISKTSACWTSPPPTCLQMDKRLSIWNTSRRTYASGHKRVAPF